jgi:hypothetical protein
MVAAIRRRFDDDDDLFDADGNGPYDKRYPGQRVVADGGKVRVPIQLTDGMPPDWMRPPRRALFDASRHRPHQLALADEALRRQARDAYYARNAFLRDAWRGPGNPPLPPLRDGQSPRDQYIARLTNAWRTPPGQDASDPDDDDPNAIEAQRRRWLSPGATPGSDAATATKDAAVADRDQAYGEYLDRISNGWRR